MNGDWFDDKIESRVTNSDSIDDYEIEEGREALGSRQGHQNQAYY